MSLPWWWRPRRHRNDPPRTHYQQLPPRPELHRLNQPTTFDDDHRLGQPSSTTSFTRDTGDRSCGAASDARLLLSSSGSALAGRTNQYLAGRIKWFNPGKRFGFIKGSNATELFFHQSNLGQIDPTCLTANTPVWYMVRLGSRGGGLEAYNILLAATQVEFSGGQQKQPQFRGQDNRLSNWGQVSTVRVVDRSAVHFQHQPDRPLAGGYLGVKRRPPESTKLSSGRRFRCYNCGQYAFHKAAACPFESMRKCCYYCRSSTHLLVDCPIHRLEQIATKQSVKPSFGHLGSSSSGHYIQSGRYEQQSSTTGSQHHFEQHLRRSSIDSLLARLDDTDPWASDATRYHQGGWPSILPANSKEAVAAFYSIEAPRHRFPTPTTLFGSNILHPNHPHSMDLEGEIQSQSSQPWQAHEDVSTRKRWSPI